MNLKNINLIEIGLTKKAENKFVYAKKDNKWHNATWIDNDHLSVESNEISDNAMQKMIGDAKSRGIPVYSYPMNTLKGFKRMV